MAEPPGQRDGKSTEVCDALPSPTPVSPGRGAGGREGLGTGRAGAPPGPAGAARPCGGRAGGGCERPFQVVKLSQGNPVTFSRSRRVTLELHFLKPFMHHTKRSMRQNGAAAEPRTPRWVSAGRTDRGPLTGFPPGAAKPQVPSARSRYGHVRVTLGGRRCRAWGAPAGPRSRTRTSTRLPAVCRGPGCGLRPCVVLMSSPRWAVDGHAGWARGLAGFAAPGETPGQDTGLWPAPQPAPAGPLSARDTEGPSRGLSPAFRKSAFSSAQSWPELQS